MIARVSINSPLPQLDRVFDYEVPAELEADIKPGVRVRVPFGRSKAALEAFVIEVATQSEFSGKLSSVESLVSTVPVLDSKVFKLVRSIADRQAVTASDVLRLAVPDRSVAVEKRWMESHQVVPHTRSERVVHKTSALIQPATSQAGPIWVDEIFNSVRFTVQAGESVIILVPDFRDQSALLERIAHSQFQSLLVDYSSATQKSKRYEAFLRCLSQDVSIVVGSRAAAYSPVRNLGKIIVWDDGDSSHQEPLSPYTHTREVALIRQGIEQCDIELLGHSRSTEVQRLIAIKFLSDATKNFPIPRIANSDSGIRVDSMAWRAIREALNIGAVLIQVAAKGSSSSAFCGDCDTRARCRNCNGPLWIDERNLIRCRWCNASNLDFQCQSCQSQKLKHSGVGSSRTVAEFGKAFPGVKIVEATGDSKLIHLKAGRFLVVSTPGAEPRIDSGYAAVVILDANRALGRDSLRASEDAIRQWSNAIALGSLGSLSVIVGIQGMLATKFSLWSHAEIAAHELANRAELRFPPAVRLASVGSSKDLIEDIAAEVRAVNGVEILGPIPIVDRGQTSEWRILLKFEYSAGALVAQRLKEIALKLSAGQHRVSAKSGRAMRPIRIKMDDSEVI